MKRFFALLLSLAMVCACFGVLAEGEHEHAWGEFTPAESGHTALCAVCGETLHVKHYNFSVTLMGRSVSVCTICGSYHDSVLPLITGAKAASQKANPSTQRGEFLVRGMKKPFPEDETIVFAFTAAYTQNGALATWKDISTVTLPLPEELPEDCQLIRVSPASGDDSVQNPEQWIEMEAQWENGELSFTTKTPALYLLKLPEGYHSRI